ncbi:MAG: MoxR family ATPase [Flavobacteriia bacterium]|nr:MoxR family ATPase [Flavobacteriia bacterium]
MIYANPSTSQSSEQIRSLSEKIALHQALFEELRTEIGQHIVGQKNLIDQLFIALLCNGHVLLEGVPGLAKTSLLQSLSSVLNCSFNRIQFTPDLLPADLTGTPIYQPKSESFKVKKGPIFASFILADEINRAPAKVQSALLEAMQEQQVTIGDETFQLPNPFLVMATQNPLEQEGTYPLPEAQMDRFMLKIHVDYPTKNEELAILRKHVNPSNKTVLKALLEPQDLLNIRALVEEIYMDEKIEHYIVDIITATRNPSAYGMSNLSRYLQTGASPRGTLNLARAAKAQAFLENRAFVIPEDLHRVATCVLNHRLQLHFEASLDAMDGRTIVQQILATLEVP